MVDCEFRLMLKESVMETDALLGNGQCDKSWNKHHIGCPDPHGKIALFCSYINE